MYKAFYMYKLPNQYTTGNAHPYSCFLMQGTHKDNIKSDYLYASISQYIA